MRTRVAWPSRRRQVQSGVPYSGLIPVVPSPVLVPSVSVSVSVSVSAPVLVSGPVVGIP